MMIPRVHRNLSAPGIPLLQLSQFGLTLLTAGALALTASLWWEGNALHEQIDVLEEQAAGVETANQQLVAQARAAGLDLSHQAIRSIPSKVTFVKQVRERVGFSWTQLLTDLETAIPSDITLNSVSLNEKTDTILLQGSAASLPDLNRLIHQLEKHAAFQNVLLSQHSTKTTKEEQVDSHSVFSLTVTYDARHPTSHLTGVPKQR
ncbi:PilN domain-containing protein [Nitrospira sp. T9]|uniref:PilN domain-containing protein n=1 Tax=unclassified Nitrospira TaxID=2652172 RepID=UPI003F99D4BB